MKILTLLIMLIMLIPTKEHREMRGPRDHFLYAHKIGIYGDNGERRQGELWKHDRLEYYKVVLRHPYEEITVEDDGDVNLHKTWINWGGW